MKLALDIHELAPGGEGVAHADIDGERRAVFVPGVAAGERVEADVDASKRPARGRLLAVLGASRERVAPPCRWVEPCGGCDWMHLSSDARRAAHAAMVARLLPTKDVEVVAHAAVEELAYRMRARLHVDVGRSGKVAVGMFGRRTRDPVVVDACAVLHPELDRARSELASLLEGSRGRGEAALALGPLARDPRPVVLELRWSGDLPASVFARLEAATKAGWLAGARVFAGAVKVPATIGDPTPWMRGADDAPLRLAPGGFSQASEAGNARLAQAAAAFAAEIAGEDASALELFSGAGNLTVLLARRFRVTAVEAARDACEAARKNLEVRGLEAKVVEADAEAHEVASTTKLVVLDPPRTGARNAVTAIAKATGGRGPAVVYVSCDPPTLGRDLAILARAGYDVRRAETFDMFPQTSHVETVVSLVRAKKPKAS